MYTRHEFRPGNVQNLVAALMPLEVIQGRICRLKHRAHRTVGNQNALGQRGAQDIGAGRHRGILPVGAAAQIAILPDGSGSRSVKPGHVTVEKRRRDRASHNFA